MMKSREIMPNTLIKLIPVAAVVLMFGSTAALAQSSQGGNGLFGLFKGKSNASSQITQDSNSLAAADARKKKKDKQKKKRNTNRGGSFYGGS